METTTEIIKEKVGALTARLDAVQDRVRVKSSLLNLEAKEAGENFSKYLNKLRGELHELERKAEDFDERVSLQAKLGLMEAGAKWEELKKQLDEFGDQLDAVKNRSQASIDRGRIQAHLAKLDAKDLVAAKVQTWKQKFIESKADATEEVTKSLDQMLEGLENLIARYRQ